LLGRFGRFFYFGAREYGVHPTSKAFRLMNYFFLNTFARALDNYAFSKTVSGRGFYVMRHFGITRFFVILSTASVFLIPFTFTGPGKIS